MSRARNLADYVSTGVTAAEFDFLDTTSGTPGSGTFLRGDKTWVAAGSTSASDLDAGTLAVARMAVNTVVQVKHYNTETQVATTGDTLAEAVSGAITTSNATNKILVIAHMHAYWRLNTGTSGEIYGGGVLDATWSGGSEQKIFGPKDGSGYYGERFGYSTAASTLNFGGFIPMQFLFEPDYEGAVTISAKAGTYGSVRTTTVNVTDATSGQSSLILMEVVAT